MWSCISLLPWLSWFRGVPFLFFFIFFYIHGDKKRDDYITNEIYERVLLILNNKGEKSASKNSFRATTFSADKFNIRKSYWTKAFGNCIIITYRASSKKKCVTKNNLANFDCWLSEKCKASSALHDLCIKDGGENPLVTRNWSLRWNVF